MRKFYITADTDVSYDIYNNLMIVGKTKINRANCKNIILHNNKMILEVEKPSQKGKNKLRKINICSIWKMGIAKLGDFRYLERTKI